MTVVRNGPRGGAAEVGMVAEHARVSVACWVEGESVTGAEGTSSVWYRLSTGKYVGAAHVAGVPEVGAC